MKYLLFGISLLIFLLAACRKNDIPMIIEVELTPESGSTTDTFKFDFSKTMDRTLYKRDVFFRIDWEGNGIYDTPSLSESFFYHRYLSPGTYKPTIEMVDWENKKQILPLEIIVSQGYSSPQAQFSFTPAEGNIETIFLFDAKQTNDDEDSLSTLKFRWDFEDDGFWDTPFQNIPQVTHVFNQSGIYNVMLQVKDPGGLISARGESIKITLIDTCLKPTIEIYPEMIVQNETVFFSANKSHSVCNDDEVFKYKWFIEGYYPFETEWRTSDTLSYTFQRNIDIPIKLGIRNSHGLENYTDTILVVNYQNQPPDANFRVSTFGGNTNTIFRFDCWDSRDKEEAPSALFVRWDFNGDGIFDTNYSQEKEICHQFKHPGEYSVKLEVKDNHSQIDHDSIMVYVDDGIYETGIILDTRCAEYGYEYYGTVKIGDQWWFSRNLRLTDSIKYDQTIYNYNFNNIRRYGCLYPPDKANKVCPEGWGLPTKADWEELFDNYEKNEIKEHLILGGNSGFNAEFGGLADKSVYPAFFTGLNNVGHYLSSTKLSGQFGLNVWFITFNRSEGYITSGYGPYLHYSVRCIKLN